jgi:hypothetical protein
MSKLIFPIACLLLFWGVEASAETLVLEPNKDNTLYEDASGQRSNGAGQYLFMGRTGGDKGVDRLLRRALLSFDLSTIEPGSLITRAELQVSIDQVPIGAFAGSSTVHRLLGPWGEGSSDAWGAEGQGIQAETGDATWIHSFFTNSLWITAGGDFTNSASQSADFGSSTQVLTFASSEGLIADVETWVNQPDSNFGWVILGDEPSVQNARRFPSRENANQDMRPKLTVEYTPVVAPKSVPAMGRVALLLLAGLMLTILWFNKKSRPIEL